MHAQGWHAGGLDAGDREPELRQGWGSHVQEKQ